MAFSAPESVLSCSGDSLMHRLLINPNIAKKGDILNEALVYRLFGLCLLDTGF